MKGTTFFVLFLVHIGKYSASELCDVLQQVEYESSQVQLNDNSMDVLGFNYLPGTFWKEDDDTFVGCPCKMKKCIQHCSNLGTNSTYSLRATKRMVWSSVKKQNSSRRKTIKVQGRGWSTNDLFKDFHVFNEIQYLKSPTYYVLPANETSLDDLQQGQQVCFVFLKNKDHGMKIAFRKKSGAELDDLGGNKAICAAISAVCFALLLAAFVITKETKFIQGKSIFCHSFSMMVTFACLFVNFMSLITSGSVLCYVNGYLTHYTTMSAFFWLNVICFDVFWTFCFKGVATSDNAKRFRWYSLYAWTSPLVLTIAVLLNHCLYKPIDSFKVEFWPNACLINISREDKFASALVFFYGPLTILFLTNLLFFGLTLGNIYYTQRQLKPILSAGGSNADNKSKFLMYIKLFFTLCGLWITEMIDWFLGQPDKLWKIFYLINNLRGLWLLLFCVILSKRVRTGLLRRASWRPKWATTLKDKVSLFRAKAGQSNNEVLFTITGNMKNDTPESQMSQIALGSDSIVCTQN